MIARPRALRSPHTGEDFYFVQQMRGASGTALGVADGVGGWILSGVDPSKFSQALMYHCARYASFSWAGEPPSDPIDGDGVTGDVVEGWETTPLECLELAYSAVQRERLVDAGSSTATVLTLNAHNGLLRAANLGDSGFIILRSGSVLYHQAPQTHSFNFPRQLSKWPLSMSDRAPHRISDTPRAADAYSTSLRTGDIIVLFTDGISDNVFDVEVQSVATLASRTIASARTDEARTAQAIADRLVEYAVGCMWNKDRVSPFERNAARSGVPWSGGKPDDATAVVAIVSEGM
ncbi:protein serine/threonine phosphatase 2C [Auriculariales sp. MPI-PUGE-AT-0066]|nr:protein serine/threonine phosphatase 2C [Auriculariales sp. MPI-PUGE-AT-0066]